MYYVYLNTYTFKYSYRTQATMNQTTTNLTVTPAQAEFMDSIIRCGAQELCESLKLVHELALYHSDVPIDKEEKSALFYTRLLAEGLEKIVAEDGIS